MDIALYNLRGVNFAVATIADQTTPPKLIKAFHEAEIYVVSADGTRADETVVEAILSKVMTGTVTPVDLPIASEPIEGTGPTPSA